MADEKVGYFNTTYGMYRAMEDILMSIFPLDFDEKDKDGKWKVVVFLSGEAGTRRAQFMENTNIEQVEALLNSSVGKNAVVNLMMGRLIMLIIKGRLGMEEYDKRFNLFRVSSNGPEGIDIGFLCRNVDMIDEIVVAGVPTVIITLHSLVTQLVDEIENHGRPDGDEMDKL